MLDLQAIVQKHESSPMHLVAMDGLGGDSKTVFLVHSEGKNYKIRKCNTEEDAIRISSWLSYLHNTNIAPYLNYFYGRIGKILIKEWVNGRELNIQNEDPKIFELLGVCIGKIHHIPIPDFADIPTIKNYTEQFMSDLEVISSQYPMMEALREEYLRSVPPALFTCCMYKALAPSNVLLSTNGELKLIDHESWVVDLPFGDLVRPFTYWLNTPQKSVFLEGYQATGQNPAEFNAQMKLTELVNLVRWYAERLKRSLFINTDIVRKLGVIAREDYKPFYLTG